MGRSICTPTKPLANAHPSSSSVRSSIITLRYSTGSRKTSSPRPVRTRRFPVHGLNGLRVKVSEMAIDSIMSIMSKVSRLWRHASYRNNNEGKPAGTTDPGKSIWGVLHGDDRALFARSQENRTKHQRYGSKDSVLMCVRAGVLLPHSGARKGKGGKKKRGRGVRPLSARFSLYSRMLNGRPTDLHALRN